MTPAAADLLAFCRLFGMAERDWICHGTVTVAQCVALQLLLDSETDASSLATQTRVTKGAITRLVAGLEKNGWVRKRADASDKRRTVLSLTARGKKKALELRKLTEDTVTALLAAVPVGKRDQVLESLHLLRVAAEALDKSVCGC